MDWKHLQAGVVCMRFYSCQRDNIPCLPAKKRKPKLGYKSVFHPGKKRNKLPYCQEKGVGNVPSLTLTLTPSAFLPRCHPELFIPSFTLLRLPHGEQWEPSCRVKWQFAAETKGPGFYSTASGSPLNGNKPLISLASAPQARQLGCSGSQGCEILQRKYGKYPSFLLSEGVVFCNQSHRMV